MRPICSSVVCSSDLGRHLKVTLRDEALEADPSFSGMPASFVEETWVNWLPKTVAQTL